MRINALFFLLLIGIAPIVSAKTLATVNDADIDSRQLDRAITEFAASRGARPQDLERSPQFPQLRKAILQSLVERELLWQAAQERNTVPEAQVEQALARMRAQLGGEDRLQQALKAQGMSEATLAERLRRDLSIQAFLQSQVYAQVDVSDADIRKFYDADPQRFRSPDLLQLRDILIAGKDEKTSMQVAEGLARQLDQGADFAQLARTHSDDISARNGGALGYLNADDLGPELAPVALPLQAGTISRPHPGPGGVHILQVLDRKPGIQASLAEVHDIIEQQLLQTGRERALEHEVQQLRQKAKIEIQD